MNESPSFGAAPIGRFFIKMHGLRNHFVITDARSAAYRPEVLEIVRICDPTTGVGGDQLLIIQPPTDRGRSGGASAFMRILNVDGREVEACGNATRCVAWLLMEESGGDEIVLETLAGTIDCNRNGEHEVSCAMGKISMNWQDVPLAGQRDTLHLRLDHEPLSDGVALNIGNPHVVFFVDDIDAIDIEGIAPEIQKDPLFPEEVNVGVAEIEAPDRMRLKVYERGAGLTTACGSGACAAVYAAIARGLTDKSKITVSLPAGDLLIEIRKDGNAIMAGPVAYCFSGFYQS
jgi:diaminopimelate epimerase